MVPVMDYQWDGEVCVSYELAISLDRFKEIVSASGSPLEILTETVPNEFLLKHKKYETSHTIVSAPAVPLEEQVAENCIGADVRVRGAQGLGFEPTYYVGQEWDYNNPDTMQVYRNLRDLLDEHNVPYFIVVEDEGPKTSFIAGGRNPEKNLRLDNQISDIFPL